MKRFLLLTTLLLCVFATSASAGGQGSVRVPFDPEVGWATINTTASGMLIVSAHLSDGLADQEFSVSLRVRHEDGSTEIFQNLAVLSTNSQGKGNALLQVQTNPPDGSTTLRRVAVRVRRAPQPLYVAVAWDVALKAKPRW